MITPMSRIPLILLCLMAQFSHARVTAVVFDCDGVLVETERLKFDAWREALAPHHVDLSMDEYLPLVGNSNRRVLDAIATKHHQKLDAAVITAKEDAYRRRQAKGVPTRAAGVALVRYLKAHQKELNVKLGLASGGLKAEILENLRQNRLDRSFDQIISASDDLKDVVDPEGTNKPKPYVYLKIARQLGVDPKDVVVFEDSGPGVEAAARAGMTVFAVPNDMTRTQDFRRARAVLSLDEPAADTIRRVLDLDRPTPH